MDGVDTVHCCCVYRSDRLITAPYMYFYGFWHACGVLMPVRLFCNV